jgi:hypothetical protein
VNQNRPRRNVSYDTWYGLSPGRQSTQEASNINVKPRNTRKLNAMELIIDKSTRDVCNTTCINDVTIILNIMEKPNDDPSI